MKSQRFLSRLLIGALLIILVLTPVSVASAASPISYPGTYDFVGPLEFQPCPGIEVWIHESLTYRETVYFDKEGNLRGVKTHFIGTDTFYNPQKPGFELVGKFTAIVEWDLETWQMINGRGIPIHITVPGYGTVLMWTGFWSIYPSVHKAGIDSTQNPKDMQAFCSLLAVD